MAFRILSAMRIESDTAATNFGDAGPPSQSASLRAAKIEAAIRSTLFRPSSMNGGYHVRLLFAMPDGTRAILAR